MLSFLFNFFLVNFLWMPNCHALTATTGFHIPPLSGPVVDQAGILRSSAKSSLEQYLRHLLERGGAQIQIATVSDLGGLSIEEASIKITDQWKLGKKKEDRGLLLLIAPNEHKIRLEVGQGLEGDLPDLKASRIISEVIVPRLKEGFADQAVIDGVMAIVHYTDPKLLDDLQMPQGAHSTSTTPLGLGKWVNILFWLMMILLFILPRFFGSGRNGGRSFATGFLLGGMSGGGWGGSSDSGGGWSGGGGGFSGGGASGRW